MKDNIPLFDNQLENVTSTLLLIINKESEIKWYMVWKSFLFGFNNQKKEK